MTGVNFKIAKMYKRSSKAVDESTALSSISYMILGGVNLKFVFNAERNERMRNILMMRPTVAEGEAMLAKDDTDAFAWYTYGTALGLTGDRDKAIEAYSHGIAFDPFYAPNFFGRGRKLNAGGHFWQAVADFTMAIHLDSSNWIYWYYRATTLNLKGHVEESIDDFRKCLSLTAPEEHYPLADWLYTSNVELGRYKEAEESLNLVDASVEAPQMDYGYRRSVLLYKGIVKPEDFIDIPLLEKNVLPQPDRVRLELNGLYYSLYCFYLVHGEPEKAKDAIAELLKVAYPGAFAYTKAVPIARKLGLLPE